MSEHSGTKLAEEYQRLVEQPWEQDEEEAELLLRIHSKLAHHPDHQEIVTRSLQHATQNGYFQLLVCANHIACLIASFPDKLQLQQERQLCMDALSQGLAYQRRAIEAYGMLAEGECVSILRQAKQRIQENTSVSDIRTVTIMLHILKQKVVWEEKKQLHTRAKPSSFMRNFIDQLFSFLVDSQHSRPEQILKEMAQIMTHLLCFIGKDQVRAYRSMLTILMERWLTIKIYKKQVKLQIFNSVSAILEALGTFRADLFYQFLNSNIGLVDEQQYLQLLSVFIDRLDKNQRLNQSELTKTMKSLFAGVFRMGNASYRVKVMMIEQVLKISRICSCELSKYIQQCLSEAPTASRCGLVGALVLIFDQPISAETVSTIDCDKRFYLSISNYASVYEQTLRRYCQDRFDCQDFVLNPQHADGYLWDLLLIRTTVTLNFGFLLSIQGLLPLLRNLLSLALLGLQPEACLDIIQRVLARGQIECNLGNLSLATLLISLFDILDIQSQQWGRKDEQIFSHLYRTLRKAVFLINSQQQLSQAQSLALFQAVLLLSNHHVPSRFATLRMRRQENHLLESVLPQGFGQVRKEDVVECVKELMKHLWNTSGCVAFTLYLQMMGRAVGHSEVAPIFLHFNEQVEKFLRMRKINDNLLDSYKLHYYVLAERPLNEGILENCWNLLSCFQTLESPQFSHHILLLFYYFSRKASTLCTIEQQRGFLRYQMAKIEQVAVRVEQLVEECKLLCQLQQLLAFRQALLMLLHKILCRYYKIGGVPCEELTLISGFIESIFRDFKSQKELVMQNRNKIAQLWCHGQILILAMTSWVLESERLQQLAPKLFDIEENMAWIIKVYPKGSEGALFENLLSLNSQLFLLRSTQK